MFRSGVGFPAIAAALLLVVARGDTQALVPVFAVGVFVGFTLTPAEQPPGHFGARRAPPAVARY